MKRLLLGATLVLGLFGCAPKEVNYAVNIVTQSCEPAANPFDGVQFLRIRVTGQAMEPKTEVVAASGQREAKIPEIPAGLGRVIEVRGYGADPSSGAAAISIGKSLPFDVPDVVPEDLNGEPVKVNVVMRKVNTFSPIVSAAAPSQCQALRVARAGHSATLLKDGRVFIAGGFNQSTGSAARVALSDTEVYNPRTGAFEPAKALSLSAQGLVYPQPRAFQAALRAPSGQVILWGGETYTTMNGTTRIDPLATIIYYDPEVDDFMPVGTRTPRPISRSRHRMAMDANGKILAVGGITRNMTQAGAPLGLANEVEWLDPGTAAYLIVDGVTLPRYEPTVMPVKNGEYIAVIGGSDGTTVKSDITFFKFAGTTFAKQLTANPPKLAEPGRRGAAGASIRDGQDVVIFGGDDHTGSVAPPATPRTTAKAEILAAASASVSDGQPLKSPRSDLCAVTLSDGRVLTAGGRTANAGPASADATAELMSISNTGAIAVVEAPKLPKARYWHTCTLLLDGSVLVTGGLNELADGTQEVLQDAYIYTPAPPAD